MEYQILMGIEQYAQLCQSVEEHVWILNNPCLGPEQKWFYPRGFLKVAKSFRGLSVGDTVLIDGYAHTRVVKMATSTQRQEFISYSRDMNTHIKLTPEEYSSFKPLTTREIYRLIPHMSARIKHLVGYRYWSISLPEYLCVDCQSKMPIEYKDDKGKFRTQRRCNCCGKNKAICNNRSDFKPKGR